MAASIHSSVCSFRPASALPGRVALPNSSLCLRAPLRAGSVGGSVYLVARTTCRRQAAAVAPAAVPVEAFQLAGEGGFIAGTAGLLFAMVLVGLALGFVLLRVESLVEDGMINF